MIFSTKTTINWVETQFLDKTQMSGTGAMLRTARTGTECLV